MSKEKQFAEFDPILQKSPASKGRFRLYLDEQTSSFVRVDDSGNESPLSPLTSAEELKGLIENNLNYLSESIGSSFSSDSESASLAVRSAIISDQLNILEAFGDAPPIIGIGSGGYLFITDFFSNGVSIRNFLDGVIPSNEYFLSQDIRHVDTTCNYIGDFAFCESSLISINGPYASYIGSSAFSSSYAFSNAYFPNVQYMGQFTFGDAALVNVNFPKLIEVSPYCFSGCLELQTFIGPSVTHVGENSFGYCPQLTYISIPNVEYIAPYAFYEIDLLNLNFPKLIEVGSEAFSLCNLTGNNIPLLEEIPPYCFYQSDFLMQRLDLPSVKNLNGYAFVYFNAENTTFVMPNLENMYAQCVLGWVKIDKIVLPNENLVIHNNAFEISGEIEINHIYLNCPFSNIEPDAFIGLAIHDVPNPKIHVRPPPYTPDGWTEGWFIIGGASIQVQFDWTNYPEPQ